MGGINCDNSNGRCHYIMSDHAQWAENHKDQAEYGLAVALYSRAQFAAHSRFLELQIAIELTALVENTVQLQRESELIRFRGVTQAYASDLDALGASLAALEEAAAKNFAQDDLRAFVRAAYKQAVASEGRDSARAAGFIPDEDNEWKATSGCLTEDGEFKLFAHHRAMVDALCREAEGIVSLCATIESTIREVGITVAIRELRIPLVPFSLRSQTLWLRLSTSQVYWAFLNLTTFRSVTGVETPVDKLLKSGA